MGQASFKSVTKDEYFEKHVKDKTGGPPVGSYRLRFGGTDAKIQVPVYGSKQKWDGHMRTRSQKIKENTFRQTVHKCDRLDKALCYNRKMFDSPDSKRNYRY